MLTVTMLVLLVNKTLVDPKYEKEKDQVVDKVVDQVVDQVLDKDKYSE